MKIFSLIVALLIWALTAFGCEPAKPVDSAAPTPEPTAVAVTPTSAPKAKPGKSSSSHGSSGGSSGSGSQPEPQVTDVSDEEDTLLPEI